MPLTIVGGFLLMGLLPSRIFATPVPQNLGNGLREIVEKQRSTAQVAPNALSAQQQQQQSLIISHDRLKLTDAQGRILVNITLKGTVPLATVQSRLTALGANITASDPRYRAGIIEGFVPLDQVTKIAKMDGVSAVHLVPKPVTNIGKATTQGIVKHRIDQISSGLTGTGITVGVLSDSYNLYRLYGAPRELRAGADVASGDLPGAANPFGHTQPVVLFEEGPYGNDEGRAMLQIVHDIAPDARLGFATAFTGEVEFANNIRSLAGLPSGSLSKRNFKADVVIDDVIYFAEPMFQDGIVAQAVDEIAAAGVAYFSAAGNSSGSQAYDSAVRLVAASPGAVAGTNLDFTGVDPALYAGGFHNFASGGAQDVAQTIHIDGSATISFQWNEPFDQKPPTLGNVLQSGAGTLTSAMPTKTFPFSGTAGQHIGITADAAPRSSNPLPDSTITLIAPNGNQLAFQDTTTNPEVLTTFLPVTGTYQIRIGGHYGATGDFVYSVREASGAPGVVTDFNLLFFGMDGRFLGRLAENNLATGRPIEVGQLYGTLDVQMVIARGNTPALTAAAADHIRDVWFDGGQPLEFVKYLEPATYGHSCAAGGNGVGAYAFYPPYIPESFTSTGPVTIYFDKDSNRLPRPEVRAKPDMSAMDGANTTFFAQDTPQDPDGLPNFFGTSAAAPHAGGIAALMLQAAGGRHSVTPDAVRFAMQQSAFMHDLDPYYAHGTAQNGSTTIDLAVRGDRTLKSSLARNFFRVGYSGANSLTSLTLNLAGANTTERPTQGLVFDPNEGQGFPFTLGNVNGVPRSAVTTQFTDPVPSTIGPTQYRRLTLSITAGAMTNGDVLKFGVDRDEADAFRPLGAVGGNSADLFGAEVLLPQGTIAQGGATFSIKLSDGSALQGVYLNNIGEGYSPLDGFGFVNAQAAVQAVQKFAIEKQ